MIMELDSRQSNELITVDFLSTHLILNYSHHLAIITGKLINSNGILIKVKLNAFAINDFCNNVVTHYIVFSQCELENASRKNLQTFFKHNSYLGTVTWLLAICIRSNGSIIQAIEIDLHLFACGDDRHQCWIFCMF